MELTRRISTAAAITWRFRFHLLCALVVIGLWDTPLVKPFRVLVVLVHEACHAAASLVSGGQVVQLRTHWDESGMTLSHGGYFPLISAAGYVGSALLGALLLYSGMWPRLQRLLLFVVGCGAAVLVLLYTPFDGLDFYFGMVAGLALAVAAMYSSRLGKMAAGGLGVMLCLYSLYDFRSDLWSQPQATDAGLLAQHLGLPWLAYPIALSWVLVSLGAMYWAMKGLVLGRGGTVAEAPGDPPESCE
jgi:hypothetical protein